MTIVVAKTVSTAPFLVIVIVIIIIIIIVSVILNVIVIIIRASTGLIPVLLGSRPQEDNVP